MTTIGDWRLSLRARLRPVAGDLAPYEADRLVSEVAGGGPTELTLRFRETLTAAQEARLTTLAAARLQGRPLAYVLGHVEFAGLDLLCDERALIPRPETEELVFIALESLPPASGRRLLVIDVGTGSGNIALALAQRRPDLIVIATDVSMEALALAKANRARTGLEARVHFVCGRSLTIIRPGSGVEMIVSNPPYVAPRDPNLDPSVHAHEPHAALFPGPVGTEAIAELVNQAGAVLRPGGGLVCEVGYDQGPAVRAMIQAVAGWDEPVLHRDMAGIERVLAVRRLT